MPQYRPFDVVAVAISDAADAPRRPALIVSSPSFETSTGLVWVAMITTPDHERRYGDIPISDQTAAGLPAASVIRASKLATLAVGKIKRRLGSLLNARSVTGQVRLRLEAINPREGRGRVRLLVRMIETSAFCCR
jgi:mRNA-degrading endonuclease toxin of MazEF toxin-antitoxin module